MGPGRIARRGLASRLGRASNWRAKAAGSGRIPARAGLSASTHSKGRAAVARVTGGVSQK